MTNAPYMVQDDSTAEATIDQPTLDAINVAQGRVENKAYLESLGGIDILIKMIGVDITKGLTPDQIKVTKDKLGDNTMPASPTTSFLMFFYRAMSDTTLIILMIAACVSFGIGYWEDPKIGWIEGSAIFVAVFLVSNITAGNDYSKELQFRALEVATQQDETVSVLRSGVVELINPSQLVVGDILKLQCGDMIPADSILLDTHTIASNESGLTGEPKDLSKRRDGDCFLLSSCLITEGQGCKAVVIGVGANSQWGKIKAQLVTENDNTPLQEKLERMTQLIGYIGIGAAIATFIALIIRLFVNQNPSQKEIGAGFISAFILAVTIVVVAIPEGLPLAVTISLAYSTKKMYNDKCSIRQLAACETMGNATTICSDKTGTLTENRMTVVEGFFGTIELSGDPLLNSDNVNSKVLELLTENISINRTAYLVYVTTAGEIAEPPIVVGNKTEGALLTLIRKWGFDYETIKESKYQSERDIIYSFDSTKKRSTVIIHRPDGTIRLYVKGATEILLQNCVSYTDKNGEPQPLDTPGKNSLEIKIENMANKALRTLMLCHVDFRCEEDLPVGWEKSPPDDENLVCDCIVGIIDPLRSDVTEAVRVVQRAGVVVRMVTGDNIHTASAISRQCGILTPGGIAIEGPDFRKLTPYQLDEILPRLQVLARASPEDKYLLVCRLNGHSLPDNQSEWEEKHKLKIGMTWERDRDLILPGYKEEWEASRPNGGEVVGVTGDGTNDAPALKAADVGLAMGISGTKVAQGAADVVILDDKFGSIVKAIMWGRTVYDNIRKFLQFQLTVNVVALLLVFIGAVAGFGQPLNAVMMLWVNLVMDTLGALALGTEAPTATLLQRKPYRRSANLVSLPMWRNIFCQSAFQLTMLFVLLFAGADLFHVRPLGNRDCLKFYVTNNDLLWDPNTLQRTNDPNLGEIKCQSFTDFCPQKDRNCFESVQETNDSSFRFIDLDTYEDSCLTCFKNDYIHGTIIFNAFIFCQFFNEYTSRQILDEWNLFDGVTGNKMFLFVSIVTLGAQIFLVEIGGDFVRTSPLTLSQWLITIALGMLGIPIGMLMRLIPVKEDPNSFYTAVDWNEVKSHELTVNEKDTFHGLQSKKQLSSSSVKSFIFSSRSPKDSGRTPLKVFCEIREGKGDNEKEEKIGDIGEKKCKKKVEEEKSGEERGEER